MKWLKFLCLTVLSWFCCIVSTLSPALAKDTTTVPLKELYEYNVEEWAVLQNRWTDDKVEAVVKALKEGDGILGYVDTLLLPDSIAGMPRAGYDLRLINLRHRDLRNIQWTFRLAGGRTYWAPVLQGADLEGADLRGATLRRVILQGADLTRAYLHHADLTGSNLQEAHFDTALLQDATLDYAHMQGATFRKAKMQRASLAFSNLQGANLWRADLTQAILAAAKLQRAYLINANLHDADLFETYFDSTYLCQVDLGKAKNIRYIVWGNSIKSRYVIGKEKEMKRLQDFRMVENTYRDLKTWYQRELLNDIPAEFHYRENEVITKRYLLSSKLKHRIWGLVRIVLLKWTYGYGSRPISLLWHSLNIISVSALIFLLFTMSANLGVTKSGIVKSRNYGRERFLPFCNGLIIIECLYFSLLSFATFGYGAIRPKQWLQLFLLEPVEYKPVRWARIFVGIEAALGIWIFALLVTVLFGRG